MANNIFPNDLNNCIAVEFNVIGLMKCSEDGESSDEDEDEECNNEDQHNEVHPEDGDINLLHTTNDAHNGGASHMRF
ncbi:hypothetical protein H5410_029163 [Solanum commersonii]|uniref:Uncharacterized protein n=1 Tax=Solanum commersonii TaxID=4109 RepID=A0A9J5Z6Z5_SOLCO|nr:hypothetical protein H5410_029163 [Solanum commersonii]